MYLMYVDESGDPGRYNGKNTPHFILSGLIVPMEEWHLALGHITAFREEVKQRTGLAKREEIHSSELIRPTRQQAYKSIRKAARVQLLRDFVENIPAALISSNGPPRRTLWCQHGSACCWDLSSIWFRGRRLV